MIRPKGTIAMVTTINDGEEGLQNGGGGGVLVMLKGAHKF